MGGRVRRTYDVSYVRKMRVKNDEREEEEEEKCYTKVATSRQILQWPDPPCIIVCIYMRLYIYIMCTTHRSSFFAAA